MLVSGVTGSSNDLSYLKQTNLTNPQIVVASSSEATTTATTSVSVKNNNGVEERVRNYFSDIPLMAEVSRCESQFRQYDKVGSVFRGKVNDRDVGVMQINEHYHLERAKKLGYNIYTVAGNVAYARLLYTEEGTDPWSSSSPCWSRTTAYLKAMKFVAER